ncbi:MAG: SpoIIE family protein phosphatase [Phycisphaeraceae bacterium]|nr:SpoIIE family protein phosphatase [Phycisphaeraceae bacterium]
MRLSIRWKLLLSTLIPLVIIAGAFLAFEFDAGRTAAHEQTRAALSQRADSLAERLDAQFETVSQTARAMATLIQERPLFSIGTLFRITELNVDQNSFVFGSCIAFEPGQGPPGKDLFAAYSFRAPSLPGDDFTGDNPIIMKDIADFYDYTDPRWSWYRIPRETGRPAWTEPYLDEGGGDVVMCTYSAPFFRDGKFAGVVTVDVSFNDLRRLVEQVGTDSGIHGRRVGILSQRGAFLAWPDEELGLGDTIFEVADRLEREDLRSLGRRLASGQRDTISMRDPTTGEPLLLSFAPIISTGWSYITAAPEAQIMAPVLAALRERAVLALAVLAIIAGVVTVLGVRIARPIERLASAVKQVGVDGSMTASIDDTRTDEIGDLARTFSEMVARIRGYIVELRKETAAREAVQAELRVAREIQASLLPRRFPPFPDHDEFSLHAVNAPARGVAGDFYDYFLLPSGRLIVVIADVAGKGIPAAMLMAVSRTVIRNLAQESLEPAELLNRANAILVQDNSSGLFLTIFLAQFDPATGRLLYANAGHPRPYRMAADRKPVMFGEVTGTVLGVLPEARYTQAETTLAAGETMVLFTDGVPEGRGPDHAMFGEQRFAALLAKSNGEPVRELCTDILAALDQFQVDHRADDITVVALRRNR